MLAGVVLIVLPTTVLMASLGDSLHTLVTSVQGNTLQIPAPPASVADWPLVGNKLHAVWSQAHADLPAVIHSLQPKIGELAKLTLGVVAGIGVAVLLFLASFIISGIVMAFGKSGVGSTRAIFDRFVGVGRGEEFAKLSTATIRAMAQGVLGVALIQAIVVGLVLMLASVPFPGALAAIVLVLGIAQVPALLVTLPAIAWLWTDSDHGTGAAVAYTVLLAVAGMLGQRAETADAGPECRCAHAGDPARCPGRYGQQRHPRHIRRRDLACTGLSDLHATHRSTSRSS